MKNMNRQWLKVFLLLVTLLGALAFALSQGSQYIPLSFVFDQQSAEYSILSQVRFPRILAAVVAGALLSLSGLLMQNLVKNPLADPYVLGVSGASACAQLLLISSGLLLPSWLVLCVSFVFSGLSLWLLIGLNSKTSLNTQRLLLSGVVLAFAYSAIISLTLTLSPTETVKPMLFWLMGDLSYAQNLLAASLILLFGTVFVFFFHTELDILARGERFAQKSGVDVKKINLLILIVTTLFTTIAVHMAGTIGFVGLVTPHIARLLVSNSHKYLILASVILGGILVLIADTFARSAFSPMQLPVGVFTAILGVPLFLFLQWRRT